MPNETNWQDITRRLDISQADVTTACQHKERSKGRAIKKIPWKFTVPATSNDLTTLGIIEGCLLQQFNYTAPHSFRLLDAFMIRQFQSATVIPLVCVKWRVGSTVHRYMLPYAESTQNIIANYNSKVQAPLYNRERILPNFTIELWSHYLNYQIPSFARTVATDLTVLTTSLLSIPDNSDSLDDSFNVEETIMRATLVSTFPEALPTVTTDNSSWLTN